MTETITHIVLFKYRPSISWSDFESHFESFMALKTRSINPTTGKPLVKSMKAGKNRSWESFSKGMTHGFVLEFASQEDLDYYLTAEPVHLQFSKDAKPLIEDSVVVDIRDGVLFGPAAEHPSLKGVGKGVWKGSCHCEAVRWTARLENAEHVLCHCATCQKLGGGPYSCNQIIPKEGLRILGGGENVGEYKYKGASGRLSPILHNTRYADSARREIRALLLLQDLHKSYISSPRCDAGQSDCTNAVARRGKYDAGDGRDLCRRETCLGKRTGRRASEW